MCGIAGLFDTTDSYRPDVLRGIVTSMTQTLVHRGPDDSGIWCDPQAGAGLGFRRLAILDLSPTGRQPMFSHDERYVMVFNGEVYNYGELRDELSARGESFRGSSDTEVLLAAISHWGLERAVARFNGMFAIALWDRTGRRLHLIRDRVGIKPLYYAWAGSALLFGSELKALRAHPAFGADIDRNALALYLRYGYVPAPFTIYRGAYKLPPGSILSVGHDEAPATQSPKTYWSGREVVERGCAQPFDGDEQEAIEALDALLRRSIGLRMLADVPLGAFLSGGVNSSTVVALMQAQSARPVKTFAIGFREGGFDEAKHAAAVARHLGTDHSELYLTPGETRDVIPLLPALYDEPFADSSQIPTYLVSKLARREVTVSLSGDGGDELFGGYKHYSWTPSMWRLFGWVPPGPRNLAAAALRGLSASGWADRFPTAGGAAARDRIDRLAGILSARDSRGFYLDLVSQWKEPDEIVLGGHEPVTLFTDPLRWAHTDSLAEWMMFLDLVTYLPDDILTKLDRASMSVSLEARPPLLDDHEVVEFAWKLPLRMKVRRGTGKWILRQVLYKYVPKELVERPKQGFSVPLGAWLRGPLRDWAEALLDEQLIREAGFFHPEPIRQKWGEHLSGNHNWQNCLWDILMFQAWHRAARTATNDAG